ncbi:MAG: 3D domain-containing protein [Verrucomicrobiaceae bacterium]
MITMRFLKAFLVPMLLLAGVSCSSTSKPNRSATRISSVKTTAYTHTESDHIKFGAKTAIGTSLKYGRVRSAATDWSVYPLGTIFQIDGQPYIYQVDDYGSALVGTNTIDLYEPTKAHMKQWGARNVNIRVLKWGSFTQSLAVMKPRTFAGEYIRRMVDRIQRVTGAKRTS